MVVASQEKYPAGDVLHLEMLTFIKFSHDKNFIENVTENFMKLMYIISRCFRCTQYVNVHRLTFLVMLKLLID